MAEPYSNFNLEFLFGKPIDKIDEIIENKEAHVRKFEIKKRDGSPRPIIAPDRSLKWIQKRIYWKILKRYKENDAAHGFVKGRGISTNATPHVGASAVGKIDIASFFDTIGVQHLQNILFGNKNICRYCKFYESMLDGKCSPSLYHNKNRKFKHGCEEIKAVFMPDFCEKTGYQSLFKRIIELCTYKGHTVQGFPTSPMLANLVMRGFDISMIKICRKVGVTYTRYADDLSFSSKAMSAAELKQHTMIPAFNHLRAYGFKPKFEKTKYKSKGGRLKICGIVVNVVKNVQRSAVRLFRAKVHHATVKFPERTTKTKLNILKGWASFLMSINKEKGAKYMKQLVDFQNARFPRA